LDFFRPPDLATASVAVHSLEEYFSFTVLAEEPFLFKEFLGYRDTLSPRDC